MEISLYTTRAAISPKEVIEREASKEKLNEALSDV
jgi:hypothetical protein